MNLLLVIASFAAFVCSGSVVALMVVDYKRRKQLSKDLLAFADEVESLITLIKGKK